MTDIQILALFLYVTGAWFTAASVYIHEDVKRIDAVALGLLFPCISILHFICVVVKWLWRR